MLGLNQQFELFETEWPKFILTVTETQKLSLLTDSTKYIRKIFVVYTVIVKN